MIVADPPEISVIIPVFNEEANVAPLAAEVTTAMNDSGLPWDCWWVDDGSTDQTWSCMQALPTPHRSIRLPRNFGQSAAIMAGVHHSAGRWIGILDGDGQNDPRDLLRQHQLATTNDAAVVVGYRSIRHDHLVRRVSSRVGNWTRRMIVGNAGRDAGCATKVVRREVMTSLPFFHGMQCFIPDLARAAGWRFDEIPVNHRPRLAGQAKYGINNRLWSGFRDLLGVRWLIARQRAWHTEKIANQPTRSKDSAG